MSIRIVSVVFISIFLMLFTASCPRVVNAVVYNNTQSDIWFTFHDEWSNDSYFLKSKESRELCYSSRDISIFCEGAGALSYRMKDEPSDFVGYGITCERYFFQIEPDWSIYILKNGDFPAGEFPTQPEGYPLKPLADRKSK